MKKIIILTLLLSLSSGCLFKTLRKDLEEYNSFLPITGSIVVDNSSIYPVVLALLSGEIGDGKIVSYKVFYGTNDFTFTVTEDKYRLFAFEDVNEDMTYQKNERAAWYGFDDKFILERDKDLPEIKMILQTPDSVEKTFPFIKTKTYPPVKLTGSMIKIGKIIDLKDPLYQEAYGRVGMWEPVRFMKEVGAGIYFLRKFDSTKTPVLFVHGIGGSASEFEYIATELDTSKYQPFFCVYPSGLRLAKLATGISNILINMRAKYHFKEINVIAHSMGGLVALGILQNNANRTNPIKINNFITLSTPWKGQAGAAKGVKSAPVVVPSWYDMDPASAYIKNIKKIGVPKGITYSLFFSYIATGRGSMIDGNHDGTVTLESQLDKKLQDRAKTFVGIRADHTGILKSEVVSKRIDTILSEKTK